MLEMGQPDYPPEVRAMLAKIGRDRMALESDLASLTSLEEDIIGTYGAPPPLETEKAPHEPSRPRRGGPAPRQECPLSEEEIVRIADPEAILEAFAQALPAPTVYPTAAARWITGAGVVDRAVDSYRVTLRRLVEARPGTWRKEEDGGFTHVPTEERKRENQEPTEVPEELGNDGSEQDHRAPETLDQEREIDDDMT